MTEEEAAYAKTYLDLAEQVRGVLPYCFRLSQMCRSEFDLEEHSRLVRLQMAVDPDRMERAFHKAEREWRWLTLIYERTEAIAERLRRYFMGRGNNHDWQFYHHISMIASTIRDYKKERDAR